MILKVTEEWIEAWATHLATNAYYDDADRKTRDMEFGKYPLVEKEIRQMFGELGVEIYKNRGKNKKRLSGQTNKKENR